MAKIYKIYITTRKNKDSDTKDWFIVDKKSPVDYKFESKKYALEFVKENYENAVVLVQNDQAKFQYTIVLEDRKIKSFVSKSQSNDAAETAKDVKDVFEYEQITTTTTTTVETTSSSPSSPRNFLPKNNAYVPGLKHNEESNEEVNQGAIVYEDEEVEGSLEESLSLKWVLFIGFLIILSIALSIIALVIAL